VPRRTILVLDDEEILCEIVSRLLEEEGFRCTTAHSGEAALEWLRANQPWPDLFIVDIQLGGMSGTDFVLETAKQHPGTPVLYISGYSQIMLRADQYLGNTSTFLPKPFTSAQLMRSVRRLLPIPASAS